MRVSNVPVYLFSNIRPDTFNRLVSEYPHLFKIFNGIMIVSAATGWRTKEDPEFFALFEQLLERDGLKNARIIFIDNEPRHVATAQRRGWIAVQYIDTASCVSQLRTLNVPGLPYFAPSSK